MTMADYESISIGSEWQVTQDLLKSAFSFVNALQKYKKIKQRNWSHFSSPLGKKIAIF
jgi:hypothetical protein